ncbi:MAG TPA: CvpA family protein [Burkholderiales bacterium]|nr:CvpA family protein [Burkholderiales bacterium]
MTWVDYAVIAVMAVSVLWGALRGLIREIMSLGAWVIAFLAANLFAGPFAAYMPQAIQRPELRVLVAFVSIFLLALVVTTLFGLILSKIAKSIGLGGVDRGLGALFGVARGLLIVLALALAAGLTRFPEDGAWKSSLSGPWMARAALALKPWLPPALADRLRYH